MMRKWTKARGVWLGGAVIFMLLTAGCGDLIMGTQEREDRKLAQGYTPCNDFPDPTNGVICHPNQYCSSQRLGICHTGCLSEDNCSEEQTCVKQSNRSIGTCLSREEQESRRTGEDLDPGYTACGDDNNPSRFQICHPNQYCYSDYFGSCSLGCLSEHNCTEQQRCVKQPGEHIGVCQAVEPDER